MEQEASRRHICGQCGISCSLATRVCQTACCGASWVWGWGFYSGLGWKGVGYLTLSLNSHGPTVRRLGCRSLLDDYHHNEDAHKPTQCWLWIIAKRPGCIAHARTCIARGQYCNSLLTPAISMNFQSLHQPAETSLLLCINATSVITSLVCYLVCVMGLLNAQDIVDNKKLQMRGIIGLYAANAVGDDIEVYKDDSRTEVLCRWVYLCLTLQFSAVAALWCIRHL